MGVVDGCNLYRKAYFAGRSIEYAGIGKGANPPPADFVDFVYDGFRVVEVGVANEVQNFINFTNERHVEGDFNRVEFSNVQKISGTCVTGCDIVNPGQIEMVPVYKGFSSRLSRCAKKASLMEAFPEYPIETLCQSFS
jgi:hypothetical protein